MGPKIDLGPFLNDLLQMKEGGETWDELADWLQVEHNIACDSRTIQRRVAGADVAGLDVVNLDQYLDVIMQQREEGVPFDDIADNLIKQYGIRTSERRLRRRFQQVGLFSRVHLNEEEEAIRDKIEIYITRDCHTDQEALQDYHLSQSSLLLKPSQPKKTHL